MSWVKSYDPEKIIRLYLNTNTPIRQIAKEMGMRPGQLSAYLYGTATVKSILPKDAPRRKRIKIEVNPEIAKVIVTVKDRIYNRTKRLESITLIDIRAQKQREIARDRRTLARIERHLVA